MEREGRERERGGRSEIKREGEKLTGPGLFLSQW